jgi:hypothetical protein
VNNPYIQVALTYFRRLFSSVRVGFMTLLFLVMTFSAIIGARSAHQFWNGLFVLFFYGFAVIFYVIPIHIKEQFANSRAHLLPNFRKAHIVVAGAVAFVVAVLLPAAASLWLRLHSIGLLAFMVFWFGWICLAVLFQKNWQMGVIVVAFFAVIFGGGSFMEQWCSGKFELQALGLLAIGLAIIVYCGVRLCRLNEDMPEYHLRLYKTAYSGKSQNWPGMQFAPGSFRDRLWVNQMAGLIRHAQHSPNSLWSRICRWQIGMQTVRQTLLFCVCFFLYLFFFRIFFIANPNNQKASLIGMIKLFLTMIPTMVVWTVVWRRRTQSMYYEMLLPVDRATYLKQVGMAAALSQLQVWVVFGITGVLWQQIAEPQSTSAMINALACSFLCQIGLFGLAAWLVRLGNVTLLLAIVVVVTQIIVLGPLLFFITMRNPPSWVSSPQTILLAATGFAAFGLLAAWDGYRRWLVADVA